MDLGTKLKVLATNLKGGTLKQRPDSP